MKINFKAWAQRTVGSPAALFLWISLVLGGLLCVFIPFGAGFDEETHLTRIWDISALHMLPNSFEKNTTLTPRAFFDLSYQRRYFLSPAQDLLFTERFYQTMDRHDMLSYGTRSIYPPVIFLPQALVLGIGWRVFDFPIIPIAIIARLAGLCMYVLGTYWAIRILPSGKWTLFILAISPMALFQAATLNADGYTNIACFMFSAYVLKLSAERPAVVRRSQVLALIALMLVIGLAKQGFFVILLLLLILPYQRFPSKKWFVLMWGGAVLAVGISLGWSVIAASRSGFGDESSSTGIMAQIRLVLANLPDFTRIYFSGVWNSLGRYFREWVGVYGHWLGVVPAGVYWLYPGAILLALVAEARQALYSWKTRLEIIGISLVTFAALTLFFYILYYSVGNENIAGVQGRYLTALAPLLLLPLTGLLPVTPKITRMARGVGLFLGLAALALYGFGLYATYYADCAASWYTGIGCAQPVYKNIDKAGNPSIEINRSTQISQTFTNTCGRLQNVQVWVQSLSSNPSGNLHYELLDSAGQRLTAMTVAMKEVGTAKYYPLEVKPPVGETGRQYELRLSSPDSPEGQGVKVTISAGGVYYAGGKLTRNQQAVDADLIFKYMCVSPWEP